MGGTCGTTAALSEQKSNKEVAGPQGLDFCLGQITSSPALSKGSVSHLGGDGFLHQQRLRRIVDLQLPSFYYKTTTC